MRTAPVLREPSRDCLNGSVGYFARLAFDVAPGRARKPAEQAHVTALVGEIGADTATIARHWPRFRVSAQHNGQGTASLPTLESHLAVLRPAFGHLRAIDVTTDRVQRRQREWQQAGTSNATINRRGNVLRRAFNLGRQAGRTHVVPYVPRLQEHSPRRRYIAATDAGAIRNYLPAYLQDFFTVAYGTRHAGGSSSPGPSGAT